MRYTFLLWLSCLSCILRSQDSLYVRSCIKYLTSEVCFGRGYLKNGLSEAEKFIVSELKKSATQPLFGNAYTQVFKHPVNTFPKNCLLKINGKALKPGADFIPVPSSCGLKGTFKLQQLDSVTFTDARQQLKLVLKNKLTFSVAGDVGKHCSLEINRKRFDEIPLTAEIKLDQKLNTSFESRNIGCSIKGTSASDSVIVFSAHYDHLGGIGKRTFFPGANDNASGTSLLLNLIKYYSSNKPKYTTVFLFFAGEEAGLLGSRYFTQSGVLDLKKIKFLINLDLLGTGDDGMMVVNGAVYEKQFAALQQLNAEKQLVKDIRKRGKAANSDHYWFSEAGVPCFFIYTLGGITAYHDVQDIEKTLPLTDYKDIFKLLTLFVASL